MAKSLICGVEIAVLQRPVYVEYECPYCENDIRIDYGEFCDEVGEPCDWNYSIIECPFCERKIEIDGVDWQ